MKKDGEKEKKAKGKKTAGAGKFTKGFFKGFKDFITRGNVLDMAIGIVIGTAFTAIVNALVNGVILQFISILTGNANFTDLVWTIETTDISGNQVFTDIRYGILIQAILNFFIIAFVIYFVVVVLIKRQVNKNLKAEENAKRKAIEEAEKQRLEEEAKALQGPVIPEDVKLLTEIRDYLKKLDSK